MPEPTQAASYYARLQSLIGLGSSATEWEKQRAERIKAERAALEDMKNQARMMQQTQYNVTYPEQGGQDYNTSGGSFSGHQFGLFPVKNYRITDRFGPRINPVTHRHSNHTGMDFAAAKGSPIYAVADGTVRRSLFDRIYGNQTVIDFGGGVSSMYGHQSRSIVRPGQRVHRGQIIGYVGSTGRSTGPHLHFETWVNNKPVNPLSWFRWH
jgi:murein DD-endopeptidase MepM/ murein hydrolase activator NlpD